MGDPKLVITEADWDDMKPELQAKTTYRTVISMREDVICLTKKIDSLINKAPTPCASFEKRIEKLEKNKVLKHIITVLGSIAGGFGGSHIPK